MTGSYDNFIGKTISGKYKIIRFLGAGGMADVYVAEHLATGKAMALKLLKSELTGDAHLNERFKQEAMMISLIAHRNIVSLSDFGETEDGMNYMVMELLNGYPLSDAIAMGLLPPHTAFDIALQICEGMAAAHERGVVHRDLKPDNIFIQQNSLTNEPEVKILDLGIGKIFSGVSSKKLTIAGSIVGTPEYMSPEQCKGEDASTPSDIYSLGIVLYEMLFGDVPFTDETPLLILAKHLSDKPPWDDNLSKSLGVPDGAKKIILRALEKDPAKRHESMLDFQRNIATLKSRFKHGKHYSLPSPDVIALKKSIAPPPMATSSKAKESLGSAPLKRKKSNVKADSATMFADSEDTFLHSMTAPKNSSVKIAENTYFVGVRNNTRIENNSYLRIFKGNNTQISLLIDPGSSAGFDKIKSNISEVIGSIENLNYIFLTDHDSVSLGNLAKIQELNPSVITICSEDTWLHASSLGHGSSNKYISIQSVPGNQLMFNTGHAVQFIKADFCHSRGSAMMFDPENGILFSGSLFSGTATTKDLFCNKDSLVGINLYHQLYMPGRRALMRTIKNVENLTIPPQLLAPRHGTIIRHENIKMITEQIASLRIGSDLLEYNERNPKTLTIANKIVAEYGRITGKKPSVELIEKIQPDHNTIFDVQEPGRIVGFRVDGLRAIESLIYQAEQSITPELVSQLKFALAEIKNDLRTVRA